MAPKKAKRSRGTRGVSSIPSLPGKLQKLKNERGRGPVSLPLKEYALKQVKDGMSAADAARLIDVTAECVRLWLRQNRRGLAAVSGNGESPSDGEPADTTSPGTTATKSGVTSGSSAKSAPVSAPSTPAKDHAQGVSSQEKSAILNVKKRHPSMGPAQIRAQLKRFKGWRVSVRLIARILKENGYELVHTESRPKDKEFGSFEAPHRNALWLMQSPGLCEVGACTVVWAGLLNGRVFA